jgi:hypothetical protein
MMRPPSAALVGRFAEIDCSAPVSSRCWTVPVEGTELSLGIGKFLLAVRVVLGRVDGSGMVGSAEDAVGVTLGRTELVGVALVGASEEAGSELVVVLVGAGLEAAGADVGTTELFGAVWNPWAVAEGGDVGGTAGDCTSGAGWYVCLLRHGQFWHPQSARPSPKTPIVSSAGFLPMTFPFPM